jgi:hypothetical protein
MPAGHVTHAVAPPFPTPYTRISRMVMRSEKVSKTKASILLNTHLLYKIKSSKCFALQSENEKRETLIV